MSPDKYEIYWVIHILCGQQFRKKKDLQFLNTLKILLLIYDLSPAVQI